jgi:hypothetical protein
MEQEPPHRQSHTPSVVAGFFAEAFSFQSYTTQEEIEQ